MAASPDPAQSVAPAPAPAPASAPAPAPAPAPASAQAPSQPQPQPQSSSFGRWFSGAADWCKGEIRLFVFTTLTSMKVLLLQQAMLLLTEAQPL